MAFSVFSEKAKHRLVMRASCLCWPAVIKFIIWRLCLEGLCIFNHYNRFLKCEFMPELQHFNYDECLKPEIELENTEITQKYGHI